MFPSEQNAAARTETNRLNAQNSTGPRTPEGKSRVRLNAVKHGLSGENCLLTDDNLVAYNKLGEHIAKSFLAVTEHELRLVATLHDTQWRLNRIPALEMNLDAHGTVAHYDEFEQYEEPIRSALAQAAAYQANARMFDQLGRHETRLQRLYARTKAELLERIEARKAVEKQAALKSPQQIRSTNAPTGFELQNDAAPNSPTNKLPDFDTTQTTPQPYRHNKR